MSESKKVAIAYASMLGWKIFPLHYKSKAPITKHGFKDATNDLKQINEWWDLFPQAGIGLPTGKVNNTIVLDVDPRNGGDESFQDLIEKYGDLPQTVQSLTGGGGEHYFFSYNSNVNKSKMKDYKGLDIQRDGRYVVLPPSTHPDTNKKYEWEVSSRPVVNQIADMPSWLIGEINKQSNGGKYNAKPVEEYLNILEGVPDGERTNSMTSLIGHLINKKIDYRIAYQLTMLWNERNDPPIEESIVTKTFNNILRLEMNKGAK